MLGASNFSSSPSKLKERTLVHKRISDIGDLQKSYVIGEIIGRGNFGTVVKAKHRETKNYWAIKLINKREAGASRVLLVEREIHILKLVNHPNIIFLDCVFESPKVKNKALEKWRRTGDESKNLIHIIAQISWKKAIYLVFELCLSSLAKTFKEKRQFKEIETINVMKNLACALGYLHKNDIVHRDLKLENILITENPIDPEDPLYIKVTDFGLSAMRNGPGHDNMLHDFCGTITYMAPEMLTTKSYSQQCDVWSMGVIMYVLLTGKLPFFSGNELQLCRLISTADVDYSVLQCSNEGKHLISKLLERNPAFRITAAEVIHHPWISGTPGNLSTESCNVLDMMRLWKNEMSETSPYVSDLLSQISQMNRATTSTQTEERHGLSKIDERDSEIEESSILVTANTSVTYSNKSRRRLTSDRPDYSWVAPKIDTNLSNSRREVLRKKALKNRLNDISKE